VHFFEPQRRKGRQEKEAVISETDFYDTSVFFVHFVTFVVKKRTLND